MSASTPLIVASCKGYSSVIAALLEDRRTKVNCNVAGGWTALMWAAWSVQTYPQSRSCERYGHLSVVELLIAAPGIKMDQLNNVGHPAAVIVFLLIRLARMP